MAPAPRSASVPLAEAKNQLSALVSRVEHGEDITITRRGVPVARLVHEPQPEDGKASRHEVVGAALSRLLSVRADLMLDGDLRQIAREGLD